MYVITSRKRDSMARNGGEGCESKKPILPPQCISGSMNISRPRSPRVAVLGRSESSDFTRPTAAIGEIEFASIVKDSRTALVLFEGGSTTCRSCVIRERVNRTALHRVRYPKSH